MNGTICSDNNKCTIPIAEIGLRGEVERELGNFKPLNLTLVTCSSCGLLRKIQGEKLKKKKQTIFLVPNSRRWGRQTS